MSGVDERELGFGLSDFLLVVAVGAVLLGVLGNLFRTTRSAAEHTSLITAVHVTNQAVVEDVRNHLLAAVDVCEGDERGQRLFRRLRFPPAATPLVGTRLPRRLVDDAFRPEYLPGEYTGNALLFAELVHTCRFAPEHASADRPPPIVIDAYRLVAYYQYRAAGGSIQLARYVSLPVVDHEHLVAIADDATRERVLRDLLVGADGFRPIHIAWRRGTAEFFRMDRRSVAPVADDFGLVVDHAWCDFGLVADKGFRMVQNDERPRFCAVLLGRADETPGDGDGFPHGFEVQLAGRAGARQLMLHTTIVGTDPRGLPVSSDIRTVAIAQDR